MDFLAPFLFAFGVFLAGVVVGSVLEYWSEHKEKK